MRRRIISDHNRKLCPLMAASVACLYACTLLISCDSKRKHHSEQNRRKLTDSSAFCRKTKSSSTLKETRFLVSLNSKLPNGVNAIWAATLPIAWKEYFKKMGPNYNSCLYGELGADLISSNSSESDLVKGTYLVETRDTHDIRMGQNRTRNGTLGNTAIHKNSQPANTWTIFSRLSVHIKFRYSFPRITSGMIFNSKRRSKKHYEAFGFDVKLSGKAEKTREQVSVLFFSLIPSDSGKGSQFEYAVDLDRYSSPYQVVISRISKMSTLMEMYNYVSRAHQSFKKAHRHGDVFPSDSNLIIPVYTWSYEKSYAELQKGPIVSVKQRIDFRLDRFGVSFDSSAPIHYMALPVHYEFNTPHLLYIIKRGAKLPCFVMWIENPELFKPRELHEWSWP